MQQFRKLNKGYQYLLMVLDVFSKYGCIVLLKDKKALTVAEAFKNIFKEGWIPQYLWTDKGKEYYNKHLKDLLQKYNKALYSTENEKNLVLLKDGIEQSKQKCGNSLLLKVAQYI